MASTGGIEASYDFFRLGFVNSGLLSDKAPVQQVMKQHPKAKTYTEKVGLMGEHVKEVLAKDGMDAEQQVLVATKWERSSRVMVYQTFPHVIFSSYRPVPYGDTPIAAYEVGRQGPFGCCGSRPMRMWEMLNLGGMASNVVDFGQKPVDIGMKDYKTVFPKDPPFWRAHQLVLQDEKWVAWSVERIFKVLEAQGL